MTDWTSVAQFADLAPGGVVLLAMALALVLLFRRLRRRWRNQDRPPNLHEIREDTARKERAQRLRKDADQALVDLLETSREISAQMDTRIRMLNRLVKDADTEARRLEALLGRSAEESAASQAESPDEKPAAPSPTPAPEEAKTRPGPPVASNSLHARIAALHAEGRPPAEIARMAGLSVQEVNLVLHLLAGARRP